MKDYLVEICHGIHETGNGEDIDTRKTVLYLVRGNTYAHALENIRQSNRFPDLIHTINRTIGDHNG